MTRYLKKDYLNSELSLRNPKLQSDIFVLAKIAKNETYAGSIDLQNLYVDVTFEDDFISVGSSSFATTLIKTDGTGCAAITCPQKVMTYI